MASSWGLIWQGPCGQAGPSRQRPRAGSEHRGECSLVVGWAQAERGEHPWGPGPCQVPVLMGHPAFEGYLVGLGKEEAP